MKLIKMISEYTKNIGLTAKLNKKITLDDGTVFKKNTISDFLIKKTEETYHFEAKNSACTVNLSEITFV